MESKYQKGIVFGVFDTFHKGHEYFLTETKKKCYELVVVVTLPEVVALMKKREPKDSLEQRIKNVKDFNSALNVVVGDLVMGEWKVLKTHRPNIALLGYDQEGIAKELDRLRLPYEFINSYEPHLYKSSLIRME